MPSGDVVYEWTPPGGRSISCKIVARTTNHNAAPDTEEAANARLIAAAPELLEALQCVTEFAAGFCEGFGLSPNAGPISAARAAIAKAKGTAQ